MNSEYKPGPVDGKSRRAFIQKIGTAAAASSLAASVSAAQQPPAPPARAPETWPEPGPLSKQPMPTIRLGKHQVGRLVLGIKRHWVTFFYCAQPDGFASGTRPNSRCRSSSIVRSWASTSGSKPGTRSTSTTRNSAARCCFSSNSDAVSDRRSARSHQKPLRSMAAARTDRHSLLSERRR